MAPLGRMLNKIIDSGFIFRSCKFNSGLFCSHYYSTDNKAQGQYQYLKVEKRGNNKNVTIIQLNRPRAMNALSDALIFELSCALYEADTDKDVGVIVITGNERAFAVGDDIKEMYVKSMHDVLINNFPAFDISLGKCRKILLAAVNGYALGGGCELAMLCDIIYAGEKAQFGQPEIALGTIPGVGGTQRLTRSIGKSKAMEMVLTGNRLSAYEAEKAGLVSKVFPPGQLVDETVKIAERIAELSRPIVGMCKESVNKGYSLTLAEAAHFDKRISQATFSTLDKKGLAAFVQEQNTIFRNQ